MTVLHNVKMTVSNSIRKSKYVDNKSQALIISSKIPILTKIYNRSNDNNNDIAIAMIILTCGTVSFCEYHSIFCSNMLSL